jgi:hypothetical protein
MEMDFCEGCGTRMYYDPDRDAPLCPDCRGAALHMEDPTVRLKNSDKIFMDAVALGCWPVVIKRYWNCVCRGRYHGSHPAPEQGSVITAGTLTAARRRTPLEQTQ